MGVMKRLHGEREVLRDLAECIQPLNPWQSKMKAFLLDEIDAVFKLDGAIDGEPLIALIERFTWLEGQMLVLKDEAEQEACFGNS